MPILFLNYLILSASVRLYRKRTDCRNFSGYYPKHPLQYEAYARDISRKVRSAQRLRGAAGMPLSLPPYGYMKDPENPRRWIVDEEAAKIVRYIYKLCIDGVSEWRIADQLEKDEILKPSEYWKSKGVRKPGKSSFKDSPYY